MAWYHRLLNLVSSERHSRDLDREMTFHLSERTDDLVARGMSESAAMQEARRRFGNRGVQKERTRDTDVVVWLDSFAGDLRYALRSLRSSPGFAAVAIMSLALGIGANTAIFSLINSVAIKTLPVNHPEELVQVTMAESGGSYFTNPLWEAIRDAQTVFTGAFAEGDHQFNLASGGEVQPVDGNLVSGDFFSTLGVRPAAGRLFVRSDDVRGCRGIAVIAYGFWQGRFNGDPRVIGQMLSLDGHPFEIVGVAQAGFLGTSVGRSSQIYAPLCSDVILRGQNMLDNRSMWFLRVLARPKPDLTAAALRTRLAAMAPAIFAATLPEHWPANNQQDYLKRTLGSVPAAKGISPLREQFSGALLALMVVVGMVLLIACANVANLLLARASARQREMAIRIAIGAGRGRVIRQLLTESTLLSFAGAALGVLIARWGSQLLVNLLSTRGDSVSLDLGLDGHVLAFTIVVAVATSLLFGLAPAWRSARVDPQSAMKTSARSVIEGHSRFTLGKALVVGQVGLSLVLVVAAGLLLGSFRRLVTFDPGFKRDGVLLVSADMRNAHFPKERLKLVYDDMLRRLRALPGVRAASTTEITPISGSAWNGAVATEGFVPTGELESLSYFNEVSEDYFSTLGTPLIAGRDFGRSDVQGAPLVALVNETAARKFFGAGSPLGKQFKLPHGDYDDKSFEVIGLVKDAKYVSLREEQLPIIYMARAQAPTAGISINFLLRTSGAASAISPAVKRIFNEVNPDASLQLTTLDEQVSASLTQPRLLATLSGFFGGLALLLAMVGLYGTMAYSVARRRTEIGIRIALGAARARVLRMVVAEVGRIVAIGVVLGALLAMTSGKLVEKFLFGVNATDPMTLAFSALLLAAVALAAGAVPAWRAARMDPMIALREE